MADLLDLPGPDFRVCYPPITYSPYWLVILGFISSTVITIWTFFSGHSISSSISIVIKSKICCCIKYLQDDKKKNNFSAFPNEINIINAEPFNSSKEASFIYGKYIKQKKSGNYGVPWYQSANKFANPHHHDKSSRQPRYHFIRYVHERPYKGWVITRSQISKYKYELKQISYIENESIQTSHSINKGDLSVPLIAGSNNDEELKLNDLTASIPHKALSALNEKIENWMIFGRKAKILGNNFWNQHVKLSEFLQLSHINDTKQHWMELYGMKWKYKHNTMGHNVFNLNGKYIMSNYKSFTGAEIEKNGIVMTYNFKHCDDKLLSTDYKIFRDNKHVIRVHHDYLGVLCRLVKFTDNDNENERKYDVEDMENNNYLYHWNFGVNVKLKVSGPSNKYYGYFKMMMSFTFPVLIIWQFIEDIMAFIKYTKTTNDVWKMYECYSFILFNGANIKQFILLILCNALIGKQAISKSNYTNYGLLTFYMLTIIYLILMIPPIITHFAAYLTYYLWLFLPEFIIIYCCDKYKKKLHHFISWQKANRIFEFSLIVCSGFIYCLFILWPIPTMSHVYSGEFYLDALVHTFNQRHSQQYFQSLFDKYDHVKQLILWIL